MKTPFDPVAWDAPKAPALIDAYEKNQVLATAELWVSDANGPEDVIVDSDGTVIVGTADGMLLQLDGNKATALASVGGRPLGLEWYGDDILVCNADLGLQANGFSCSAGSFQCINSNQYVEISGGDA